MTKIISQHIEIISGEPRIEDLRLAELLGFDRPRVVRELIARNLPELQSFGGLPCRTANPGPRGGRPSAAYHLNEGQALVICALSRTPAAAKVRRALIEVFTAWRRGELPEKPVIVKEHRRSLPSRNRSASDDREALEDRLTVFFTAYRDQPEALASWAVHNIFAMRAIVTDMAGIGF